MKLVNVEIKNFGPYRDVNFKFEKGDIFPIIALNNAGKTSFLNAIKWCLYGSLSLGKGRLSRILNDGAKSDSKEELDVSVELIFEKDKKKYPKIKRTRKYVSDSRDGFVSFGEDKLVFTEGTKDGTKRHTFKDAEHKINELLPRGVSDFFLMDGEELESRLRKNSSKISKTQIKNSIERLCKLNEYDEIILDLKTILKKLNKNIIENSGSSTAKELDINLESFKEGLINKEKELNEILTKKDKIGDELNELSNKLSESDEKHILNLENTRKKLDDELKSLNKTLSEDLILDQKTRVELMFYNLTEIHRKKLEKDINNIQQSEHYPPAIDHNVLRDIISKKVCICGQKCEDLSSIRELLNNEDYSPMEEFVRDGYKNINEIKSRIDDLIKDLDLTAGRIESNENRKIKITEEINDIDDKLKSSKKLDIRELAERRERLNNERDAQIGKASVIENHITLIKDNISKIESKISNIILTKNKISLMRAQAELVSSTISNLEIIRVEILNEVKNRLMDDINTVFKKLHHEGKSYTVSIDDKFIFSISKKSGGMDYTNEISSGSSLLFGYALMTSLKINTGFNFPIIVDSPIGKLDHIHCINVINQIPKILKGEEIIFLFTSKEYDSDIKKALRKQNTGRDIKIVGHPDEHYSEVIRNE